MRRVLLVALALAAWPGAADASEGRWGLSASGDPLLTAPRSVRDDVLPDWWMCPNGQPCRLLAGRSRTVEPGETAVATTFDVEISPPFAFEPADERSPLWLGRVRALTRPALDGVAAVGSTVEPVGARWTGGWGNETSTLMLLACPARDRTDCRYLGGGAPAQGGVYLYVVEYRVAADRDLAGLQLSPIPPGVPYTRPAPSALVAVSKPIGPVATSRTAPDPNAKFKVTLRSHALVDRRDITVGRITCPVRCTVELSVSGARRSFKALGTVPVALLDAPRLRAGNLRVRVRVDGRRAASGTVKVDGTSRATAKARG